MTHSHELNILWRLLFVIFVIVLAFAMGISVYAAFVRTPRFDDLSDTEKNSWKLGLGKLSKGAMCTLNDSGGENCMDQSQLKQLHSIGHGLNIHHNKIMVDGSPESGETWYPTLSKHTLNVKGSVGILEGIGLMNQNSEKKYFLTANEENLTLQSTACVGASACPKITLGSESINMNTKLCLAPGVCLTAETLMWIEGMRQQINGDGSVKQRQQSANTGANARPTQKATDDERYHPGQ